MILAFFLVLFYVALTFFFLSLCWFMFGLYKANRMINAHYDVRDSLIKEMSALNQRDIDNGYYNFTIRYDLYNSVPYQNIVTYKNIMTWWNYRTTESDNLELWSDLRFIDPAYNCVQLAELIKNPK